MFLMRAKSVSAAIALAAISAGNAWGAIPNDNAYIQKSYEAYQVVINCHTKSPELVMAVIGKDRGNIDRDNAKFYIDKSIPSECQQNSTSYYPPGLDRSHIFGANEAENSLNAYKETFSMINIIPMTKELNRGAWYQTEAITECLRDASVPVVMFAGVIWNGAHASQRTLAGHGIAKPSAVWKVLKQGPYQIAWIIPNSKEATRGTLRNWEVTVDEIQALTHFEIPADLDLFQNVRPNSWYNIDGCDLS